MQAHRERAAPLPAPSHALGRPLIAGVLLLEVNRELPLRVQAFSTSARGRIFSSSRHTGGPPAGTEACTPASPLASFRVYAHKPAPLAPLRFSRGPLHAAATNMWAWRHAWRTCARSDVCPLFRMLAGHAWQVVRPRRAPEPLCKQLQQPLRRRVPVLLVWALWARGRPIDRPGRAQEAVGSRLGVRALAERARRRHERGASPHIWENRPNGKVMTHLGLYVK